MGETVMTDLEVEGLLTQARRRGLLDEDSLAQGPPAGAEWDRVMAGPGPLPAVVSLAAWQTPAKDQLNRGTCYAFATAAAMEAAVRRTFGREVDLSEQYLFQIYKTSDPRGAGPRTADSFDTGTSLKGFQGNSGCVEAAYRMAIPLEGSAPYLDQPALETVRAAIAAANPGPGDVIAFTDQRQLDEFEWSDAVVPLAARLRANVRVTGFHQVAPGQLAVMSELAAGREVVMDIPGHTLLVVGYDSTQGLWQVKNSWGDGVFWVAQGSGFTAFRGGYALDGVEQSFAAPHSAWLGRWDLTLGPRTGVLFIHRTTDRRTGEGQHVSLGGEATCTLLGQAYLDDGSRRDVNGWVDEAGMRLTMYVAPDSTVTQPGARAGERVEVVLDPEWVRASSAPQAGPVPVSMVRPQARSLQYATIAGTSPEAAGQVGRQPAITSWGPGRLDVFLGSRGGFAHSFYDEEGWGGWERIGGAQVDRAVGIGADSYAPNRLDMLLVDERGHLHHGWHDSPRGWGYWDDLGGGFAVGTTPGLSSLAPGNLDVFAITSYGGASHTAFVAGGGWQERDALDEPGSRILTMGVAAVGVPDGGRWLASVDAATRHPLVRNFDIHTGWGPWTEVAAVPVKGVPAVTVTERAIQQAGKPVAHVAHVFWLPEAPGGDGQLEHAMGRIGSWQTSAVQLSGGNPVGVAATSWGGQRLDCVVVQERSVGDLYQANAVDHLWSDDAGEGFGIETLEVG